MTPAVYPLAILAVVAVTLITVGVGAYGVRVARTPADFLVAARQVPPMLNASAISGEYLSAASFLGVAGLVLKGGLGMLWYPVGYTAGYLVLLLLVAAPLRRFGAYTIPDFAEGRLEGRPVRLVATGFVLLIGWFYLLPQLKGAGITLSVVLGAPYWVGVVILGGVVTSNIAAGGMKGVTYVQAFQYWLKLTAIAVPALAVLAAVHGIGGGRLDRPAPPVFPDRTTVQLDQSVDFTAPRPTRVDVRGHVDGRAVDGPVTLTAGRHSASAHTRLVFPAGASAPHIDGLRVLDGSTWSSPFVDAGEPGGHPLAATYSLILATFLGTIGLPHILVRFYTNRDGTAARRTTSIVLLLLGVFYVFPSLLGAIGRLAAPGLYLTGDTDTVVLQLPRLALDGALGRGLGALVAAGAFAAFLSTSSGLLVSVSGAMAHDLLGGGVRTFRHCAVIAGLVATAAGLQVDRFDINVLVGWAFAIAASSFCPLLVLGIWWRRLTAPGAIAGLLVGGGAASLAIVTTMLGFAGSGWSRVLLTQPAIWTVPLAFTTMIAGSLLSRHRLPHDVDAKLLQLHLPEALARTRTAAGPTPTRRRYVRRGPAPAPR